MWSSSLFLNMSLSPSISHILLPQLFNIKVSGKIYNRKGSGSTNSSSYKEFYIFQNWFLLAICISQFSYNEHELLYKLKHNFTGKKRDQFKKDWVKDTWSTPLRSTSHRTVTVFPQNILWSHCQNLVLARLHISLTQQSISFCSYANA